MNQASPLDAYAASIEDLRRASPRAEKHDVEACRWHGAAIGHRLRAPRWIKW